MHILGIRIDNISKKDILEKVENFLNEEKFHQIATVNPEFILKAQKDSEFKKILNGCDLNIADGIGLKYAFLRYGAWLKARMAGVDLLNKILYLAYKHNYEIFLAISKDGLSNFEEIKTILNYKFPDIKISGADIDPKKSKKWPAIIKQELVFCNFGFPQQEKFLNSLKNDRIRLVMGIGGSFDFLTGKVLRAPRAMRFLGLEWLWRLILEPRYRFKRVINAIFVFPFKVVFNIKSNE